MILAHFDYEKELWEKGYQTICGVDEVGRGCFAGPVVTAAVIFSPTVKLPSGITDSKLLSAKKRAEFAKIIKELALAYSINEVCVPCINEMGIGKATQKSFLNAVNDLSTPADFVLIDAFLINGLDKEKQMALVKGDQTSISIAAASIIAKVYRDQLMEKLDADFPNYGFSVHKGYGTQKHRDAIKEYGLSPLHRTSFKLDKFL